MIRILREHWKIPAASGLAAGLGVAINIATDLGTNIWAWLAVGVLTVAGAIVGIGLERLRTSKPVPALAGTDSTTPDQSASRPHQTTTGAKGVVINVGRDGSGITVNTPMRAALVVAFGLVLTAAVITGLLVGRSVFVGVSPGQAVGGQPASPSSAARSPAPDEKVGSCLTGATHSPAVDVPFTCAVKAEVSTCGEKKWITMKSPDEIREPMPDEAASYGWSLWPAVADGVAGSPGRYQITVQGQGSATVVLTGIVARVVAKRSPVRGYALGRECGGDGVFRMLNVDLDKSPPVVTSFFDLQAAADPPPYEMKPIRFPYTVALDDPENFMVTGVTEECDCDWVVEIAWAAQGRTGVVVVDNNGSPFRTSSTVNARSCTVLEGIVC